MPALPELLEGDVDAIILAWGVAHVIDQLRVLRLHGLAFELLHGVNSPFSSEKTGKGS